jgi:hypothetical protein
MISPAAAGPAIEADCQASEFHAMARGSSERGTSIGPSAVLAGLKKARQAPNSAAATSRNPGVMLSVKVAAARAPTIRISNPKHQTTILRRSYRSAASPAGRVRSSTGMKVTRPISPTMSALSATERVSRASAYICQPSATDWI